MSTRLIITIDEEEHSFGMEKKITFQIQTMDTSRHYQDVCICQKRNIRKDLLQLDGYIKNMFCNAEKMLTKYISDHLENDWPMEQEEKKRNFPWE